MKTSLCALAFCCAAAPAIARAQPCSTLPVTVTIKCQAELMGGGQTRTLDAATPPTRLSMQAVGKQASGVVNEPLDDQRLTVAEQELLGDLFAIVEEHAEDVATEIDRDRVVEAFLFACEHHADQRRQSGEDFITHPVGVAKICAGMRLDTETLCAAAVSVPQRLPSEVADAMLSDIAPNGLQWTVRVWVATPDVAHAKECLVRAVKESLEREGIPIAVTV